MRLEAASRVGAANMRQKVYVHVAATRQKEWKRGRRKVRGRVHFQRSKGRAIELGKEKRSIQLACWRNFILRDILHHRGRASSLEVRVGLRCSSRMVVLNGCIKGERNRIK